MKACVLRLRVFEVRYHLLGCNATKSGRNSSTSLRTLLHASCWLLDLAYPEDVGNVPLLDLGEKRTTRRYIPIDTE
jgi:hypothetical protein